MSAERFDRNDLRAEGSQVKQNVFLALLYAHNVNMTPEAYAQFLQTALTVYGLVTRAQVLDMTSGMLAQQQFDEEAINKTISYLCRETDLETEKLGRQMELIEEVANAPALRH
jgi:hypothetical protein